MMEEEKGRIAFGRMIKQRRQANLMTMKELEEASGVRESTICKIENGAFNTGADTLVKLADALHSEFILVHKPGLE